MDRKIISDEMEIIGVFKAMASAKQLLWIWQNLPGVAQRAVHYATPTKVDTDKRRVIVIPARTTEFKFFERSLPVFAVSEAQGLAFKTDIRQFDATMLAFGMPTQVTLFSGDALKQLQIIERENEDQFSHLRAAPRKQAKEGQVAGLYREGNADMLYYTLHDISQGGMGILADDPGEFAKGEKVTLVRIDSNDLPKQLVGEVMAIRQMDEDGMTRFKVGVKFV